MDGAICLQAAQHRVVFWWSMVDDFDIVNDDETESVTGVIVSAATPDFDVVHDDYDVEPLRKPSHREPSRATAVSSVAQPTMHGWRGTLFL